MEKTNNEPAFQLMMPVSLALTSVPTLSLIEELAKRHDHDLGLAGLDYILFKLNISLDQLTSVNKRGFR